jgi:hypothetical protein
MEEMKEIEVFMMLQSLTLLLAGTNERKKNAKNKTTPE